MFDGKKGLPQASNYDVKVDTRNIPPPITFKHFPKPNKPIKTNQVRSIAKIPPKTPLQITNKISSVVPSVVAPVKLIKPISYQKTGHKKVHNTGQSNSSCSLCYT